MHSVKRILTTENQTCAIRPTAIQSFPHVSLKHSGVALVFGMVAIIFMILFCLLQIFDVACHSQALSLK